MSINTLATTREVRDTSGTLVSITVSMPNNLGRRLNTTVPIAYAKGIQLQALINAVIAAMNPIIAGNQAGIGILVLTDAQVKALAVSIGAQGL